MTKVVFAAIFLFLASTSSISFAVPTPFDLSKAPACVQEYMNEQMNGKFYVDATSSSTR